MVWKTGKGNAKENFQVVADRNDAEPDSPLYIEPGCLLENDYRESFNGKLKDECLNVGFFFWRKEALVVDEPWHRHNNSVRLHLSLCYSRWHQWL